jgi:archaeal flagellin FlaB
MAFHIPKISLRHLSGITGLETAIIMIAFVVVAAVFAYTILSAGLFSTQKSQEAVYSGLEKSQSVPVIKGNVMAKAEHTGDQGYLSQLTFTLANNNGGGPMDFTPPLASGTNGLAPPSSPNSVVISYSDGYQKVDNLFWTFVSIGKDNGNNMLDEKEKFQIIIGNAIAGQNGGNLVDALTVRHLGIDTKFSIEVKTPGGATLTLERNTPTWIDHVMNLDTSLGMNMRDP